MDFNLPVSKRTRRGKALIYRDFCKNNGKKHDKIDNDVESASCSSFILPKSKNQKLSETESAVEDFCSWKDGGHVVDSMGSYSYQKSSRKKKIAADLMEDGSENCVRVTTSDGEYLDSVQSNSPCCRDTLGEHSPPEVIVHNNDSDENDYVWEDSDVTEPLTEVRNGNSDDDDYQITDSCSSGSYKSTSEGLSEVSIKGKVITVKCKEAVGKEGKIRDSEDGGGGVADSQFHNPEFLDSDAGFCGDQSEFNFLCNVNLRDDSNCVAKRTRSHYDFAGRGVNRNLGTFRRPFCIDGDFDDDYDDWDGVFVANSSDVNSGDMEDSMDQNCRSNHVVRSRKYRARKKKMDFLHTPGTNDTSDDGSHEKEDSSTGKCDNFISRQKHFRGRKNSDNIARGKEGGSFHNCGGGKDLCRVHTVCENENSMAYDFHCQFVQRDNEYDEPKLTELKVPAERNENSMAADSCQVVQRHYEKCGPQSPKNTRRKENIVATDHCHFIKRGSGKGDKKSTEQINTKNGCTPTYVDVNKIIVDSIWDKGLLEDLAFSKDTDYEVNTNLPLTETLPLKFSFGINDSNYFKQTENAEELNQLWSEFDFTLRYDEIGSSGCQVVDSEDPCSLGEHHFVLDDQIGIVCKLCSFVKLEIKHILPSLSARLWGKGYRHQYGQKEYDSVFEELQSGDPGEGTGCAKESSPSPTTGTVWDIIPGAFDGMYPHQRDGFEFLWRNVAGGINLDMLKKSVPSSDCGNGCVISHAPGTGKTKLTIVFIQAYMQLFPTCRPLIIAPRSMLLTWEDEFKKWNFNIPFHNLNRPELSGEESLTAVNILRQLGPQVRSFTSLRLVKLYSWKKNQSILGISYRLFEQLAGRSRRRPENEEVKKILLELPGILVLDEGHTPRNDQSLIWKALSKIVTEKRIILSGTPFQNNFKELYNTLCLVRPRFADKFLSDQYRCEFHKNGRKNNLPRGKWTFLTSLIGKPMDDDMLKHIREILDPFVHVHKGSILQEKLHGLTDSVVVLQPSRLQKKFMEKYTGLVKNGLELGYFVSLISVHPSLLPSCLPESMRESVNMVELEKHRLNPDSGVKTKFLVELLRLSETLNEKVLVFSQYIDPLSLIIEQLKSHFGWIEGKEVLFMDGHLNVKQRQSSINVFNEPTSEARILLASTRACSEGINLVGASRVVLLDVVWNPSVERQAISRAYRLGQKRVVYIYHLITAGTMEGEKYCRQAGKDRLSELVFSNVYGDDHTCKMSSTVPEDKILEALVQHETLKYMFEKIIYQPKELDLIETFGLVV